MLELAKKLQTEDIKLSEKYLLKTPFHAGFWSASLIERAVKRSAEKAHGTMLDVGCGMKPYKEIFAPYIKKHFGMEYSPESGYRGNQADFCGDAMQLPLAEESIDTILCTEVLEHLPDPEKAIAEFARILKPGGIIITTAPFFFPVHDAYDFFRYSPDGIATLMKRHGLLIEKVEPLSGGGVTIALLFNLFWFELGFMWTKWLYPIGVLLRPILLLLVFLINLTGWIADKTINSPQMAFDHLTIGKKQNNP